MLLLFQMDACHVVVAKLAVVCLLMSMYNLFSCSVHSTYVVTRILCLPSGMCGLYFTYYNGAYTGFVVTNSTPPAFDLYYYPFSPQHHCYSPGGSVVAGILYMMASIGLLCGLLPRPQPLPKTIKEHSVEVHSGQSVSVGLSQSNTLVIITGP